MGIKSKNKLTQLVEACFGLVLACGELHKYLDVSEIFPAVKKKKKSFSDFNFLETLFFMNGSISNINILVIFHPEIKKKKGKIYIIIYILYSE